MDDAIARAFASFANRDGVAFASFVRVPSASARSAIGKTRAEDAIARARANARDERQRDQSEMIGAFLSCASIVAHGTRERGDMEEAYDAHARGTRELVKAFKNDDGGAWMTPALYVVVDDARKRAEDADECLRRRGEKPGRLADCGSTLMLVYRAVSQTSVAEKKASQLYVVNTLFRIYFKLNTLHLCKNLINAVNLPTFLPFDSFAKAEKVTYNFYVGRLAVFEDAYERADQHLTYAFEKCHVDAVNNARLILQYLIPVRLILGSLPTYKLLTTYGVREFSDIVEAMRRGDVRLLSSALDEGEAMFIKRGTYLILEKLRMSVYRTLFKKIHAIQGELEPAKANQIALSKFQIALKFCGTDVDIDEVECIVANLIFRKFVKGYISHKNRVVVLAKTDPFPSLKTVFSGGA